jgi:hypothetical protein
MSVYEESMKEEIKAIQTKFNYSSSSQAFVHWALHIVSNMEDEERVSDAFTDGPNDLGIDGILIVEGNPDTVILIQAKFWESGGTVERKDVREFLVSAERVLRDERFASTGNPSIIRLSRDARDVLKSPPTRVVFCYFNYGKFTDNALEELRQSQRELEGSLQGIAEVQILYFDHEGVMETYQRSLDQLPEAPNVQLPIIGKQVFEKPFKINGETRNSVVFTTKASEIGQLRNKEGRSLLLINVRYSIGSTAVNKGINKTLQDVAENRLFWFYNNGIYATCKGLDVSPDLSKIDIRGIQIVNGCQTSTAFAQALSEGYDLADAEVLMRVVESKPSQFLDNISAYTNTQNPVKARDLRSNDEVQRRLFDEFHVGSFFGRKFFYERKSGEFRHYKKEDETRARNRERIDNLKVAQAIEAFSLQKPAKAKAAGDRLFESSYGEIFVPNGDVKGVTAHQVFYTWYVWQFVDDHVDTILKQEESGGMNPPHGYLAQAQSTIVACVSYCFQNHFLPKNHGGLVQELRALEETKFKAFLQHYIQIAIHVLDTNTKAANGGKVPDENFDARRFFLQTDLFKQVLVPAIDDYVRGFEIQKIDALVPPDLRESH